ncbi:MAG: putative lipid II flippase FtsW [Actinobacteria bacterium]|nr:putative lipid II flippase FtsW [Actinomycetota bacterium]
MVRMPPPGEGGDPRSVSARLDGTAYTLMAVVLLMCLYGMVMIFSASSGAALEKYGSSYYFLLRQALWFTAGLAAMAVLARMDYRKVVRLSPLLLALSLAGLAAVLLFGETVYGSRRSLSIGPLVIQPSELTKLSLLLFAVHHYGRRRERPETWKEITVPVLAVTALACLLVILEPDLGSMLIVALSALVILYLAEAPWGKLLTLAGGGLGLTLLFIAISSYRRERFLAFLNPWSAPRGSGFHVIQSMLALGSGRLTGLGLGMSRQKFFYLPNAHTDFLFSIIGEELGLAGTLTVLALLSLFLYLGLKIARRAPDRTGRMLAAGMVCVLGTQAVVNMGAATGVLPITGVTLPFFSYGGSSLVICLCMTGILLSVSRGGGRRAAGRNRRGNREDSHLRGRDGRTPASLAGPGRRTRIA